MTIGGAAAGADYDASAARGDAARRQLTLEGPGKRAFAFPADGVSFSSRFDGGSLAHVERLGGDAFVVTIPEDAAESGTATGYTTWFYFEVLVEARVPPPPPEEQTADATKKPTTAKASTKTGGARELTLTLANMNNQRGLYANGYTVVYCAMDARASSESAEEIELQFENERKWLRVPTPLDVQKFTQPVETPQKVASASRETVCDNNGAEESERIESQGEKSGGEKTPTPAQKTETKMRLTFTHHVQFPRERVRFAFCYPYTYTKVQRQIDALDARHAATPEGPVYFHRDVLTHSLGGLPIELLTISSRDALLDTHEPTLSVLYPTGGQRALAFDPTKKRTVFITSRVHPGETPANFMLDGMLRLLLHASDDRAELLRRHFVFKIIPVLNPDGVCQGFYRTDSRGVNLNRVYENPQHDCEPAIYATKALLLNTVERYGGDIAKERVVYLDLHAHANHRGCFVYGNSLVQAGGAKNRPSDWTRQVQTQLFAKLASLHSPFFDYGACSFDPENMTRRDARDNNNATTSRAGSSRVGLFHRTDLTYVYTIECNYNEGRRRLETSTKQSSRPRSEPSTMTCDRIQRHAAPLGGRLFVKYTPAEWVDVGIGCLLALIDLFQVAPGRALGPSALADSPYRTLDGVKKSILSDLKASEVQGKDSVSTTQQLPKSSGSLKLLPSAKLSQQGPQRGTKNSSSRSIVSKY